MKNKISFTIIAFIAILFSGCEIADVKTGNMITIKVTVKEEPVSSAEALLYDGFDCHHGEYNPEKAVAEESVDGHEITFDQLDPGLYWVVARTGNRVSSCRSIRAEEGEEVLEEINFIE